MRKSLITAVLFTLFSMPALAEQKTVTLSVPGMTCSACRARLPSKPLSRELMG